MADVEAPFQHAKVQPTAKLGGVGPHALLLREELQKKSMRLVAELEVGSRQVPQIRNFTDR